jgi:homoserine acetyltransferase
MFFKTIKSDHGHDAFLIEFDQLRELLSEIFTRKHTSILSN